MNDKLKLLDVVAVLSDMPNYGLLRGEVGTLVESLAPEVWLVEFSDDDGQEYAMAELKSEQVMKLRYKPSEHPRGRATLAANPA
jgi:hypothetical protein